MYCKEARKKNGWLLHMLIFFVSAANTKCATCCDIMWLAIVVEGLKFRL